jgi:protein involved in polysaccharide export with SLBB domain
MKGLWEAEMLRLATRIVLAVVLLVLGSSSAHAQTASAAQTFVIIGEVKAPGGKPWTPGVTVGKAVASADGVTAVGRYPTIRIRRPIKGPDGAAPRFITIARVSDDTQVLPDDTVLVGRFTGELMGTVDLDDVMGPTVTVQGEVNSPGPIVWIDAMTVGEALGAVSGMTTKGKLGHIKRPVKDADGNILRYEQIKDLKPETPLLPGDILVIARRWFGN